MIPARKPLLILYLIRHGQTEWSLSGQHTGRTDIPLTTHGEDEAHETHAVVTAGLGQEAEIEADLAKWDYGDYEGKLSTDIRKERRDCKAFRDGCSHGEMPAQISSRADRLIARLCTMDGNIALSLMVNSVWRWLRDGSDCL
jgi:broad specificity phosphatase PhoE